MKILITGGAGFIGCHLCEKYVKDEHTVICLDNFMNGSITNIRHLISNRRFKLINGDIRDFDLLEKIVPGVDVIFHLAAQIHVDRSVVEPKLTYDINMQGTQNILEAARMYDVKKVVYASTSEVYGSSMYSPMDENHPLNAPHPYGASKIAADRMCNAYIQTYGMDIAVMRLFNIFGERQKDIGYGGVISIFTRRVLNNMPPIIYGDGMQTRDYTYVDDAVRAYDIVMTCKKKQLEPVNFGTGEEMSILELSNIIIDLCGKNGAMEPVFIESRAGEVRNLICDFSKAKRLFGWEPQCSLREGLDRFIQWYRIHGSDERIRMEPNVTIR